MGVTSTYPEHEKLLAVADESQAIGEFIDHLAQWDLHLCQIIRVKPCQRCDGKAPECARCDGSGVEERIEPYYAPTNRSISEILADYFGIDLKLIEREKRAMLADLQAVT